MSNELVHKAHLQLYGMFLAYQLDPDKSYWEDKFAEIREKTGVYKITCFKYAWEKNGLYNDFIPWQKEGSKWNLAKIKPDDETIPKETWHYPRFKQFNRIAASQKCQIDWVFYPGLYATKPFEGKSNVNNVHGMWEDNPFLLKVYKRDLKRSVDMLEDSYPDLSKLFYRFTNEVSHNGDWIFGYVIKNRHEFWFDTLEFICSDFKLNKLFSDTTKSDFVYLNEPSWYCQWLEEGQVIRAVLNEKKYNEYKNKPEFTVLAHAGKTEYNRTNIIETHGWYPGKWDEPVEEGSTVTWRQAFLKGGWKRFGNSTDGCRYGHGPKYIGGTYQGLNYDELYEFSTQCFTFEKPCRILEHPMECFEWTINHGKQVAKENYDLLDFDRLKAIRDAWRDSQSTP